MKFIKSSFFLLSFALLFSCTSKKSIAQEPMEIDKDLSEEMLKKGFKSGTIYRSEEGSQCPFTINIDDENIGYLLDPINLEDEFKKDGLKIWFKFRPLRMQNRCDGAIPVELSEIKLQE